MKPLRIALTKGRLEKDTVSLLESAVLPLQARQAKTFLQATMKRRLPQNIRMSPDISLRERAWISELSK